MPCWVVPAVAAEIWGVSVDHVIGAIADGSLASRTEFGFTVVDVAPGGAMFQRKRRPDEPPPRTYVVVDRDAGPAPEQQEPGAAAPDAAAPEFIPVSVTVIAEVPLPVPDAVAAELQEDPEVPLLDEEEDEKPISNWREVRARMGRSRVPPRHAAPATAA